MDGENNIQLAVFTKWLLAYHNSQVISINFDGGCYYGEKSWYRSCKTWYGTNAKRRRHYGCC
ncbi:hypothetical protein Y543_09005 [Listeria monocytogenes]|nr:hypothetical protein [Listeria monocytogenes]EAC8501849.1 hypothetical protein [Listeria monocytogenes]EAD0586946.1 hypothetical protein [Listeria monocytogenes]EAD2138688.1 hypothetical protein [Listeria monocytogenes]EAG1547397.1 hypothetical protein [Listeria monocytogenes]